MEFPIWKIPQNPELNFPWKVSRNLPETLRPFATLVAYIWIIIIVYYFTITACGSLYVQGQIKSSWILRATHHVHTQRFLWCVSLVLLSPFFIHQTSLVKLCAKLCDFSFVRMKSCVILPIYSEETTTETFNDSLSQRNVYEWMKLNEVLLCYLDIWIQRNVRLLFN